MQTICPHNPPDSKTACHSCPYMASTPFNCTITHHCHKGTRDCNKGDCKQIKLIFSHHCTKLYTQSRLSTVQAGSTYQVVGNVKRVSSAKHIDVAALG